MWKRLWNQSIVSSVMVSYYGLGFVWQGHSDWDMVVLCCSSKTKLVYDFVMFTFGKLACGLVYPKTRSGKGGEISTRIQQWFLLVFVLWKENILLSKQKQWWQLCVAVVLVLFDVWFSNKQFGNANRWAGQICFMYQTSNTDLFACGFGTPKKVAVEQVIGLCNGSFWVCCV